MEFRRTWLQFGLKSLLVIPVIVTTVWWWIAWPERTLIRFASKLNNQDYADAQVYIRPRIAGKADYAKAFKRHLANPSTPFNVVIRQEGRSVQDTVLGQQRFLLVVTFPVIQSRAPNYRILVRRGAIVDVDYLH